MSYLLSFTEDVPTVAPADGGSGISWGLTRQSDLLLHLWGGRVEDVRDLRFHWKHDSRVFGTAATSGSSWRTSAVRRSGGGTELDFSLKASGHRVLLPLEEKSDHSTINLNWRELQQWHFDPIIENKTVKYAVSQALEQIRH